MRAVVVLALLLTSACAPTLAIVSWEPGALQPRGARMLVLVDGEGRSGARHIAAQLVAREARGGWFRVEDRGREGVKLQLVGERAELGGATRPLPEDALWARVDVVEWDSEDTTVQEEDADGKLVQVPAQHSKVSLQITVADRSGAVLMREQEYIGTVIVEAGVLQLADPLEEAARVAASSFLADIAPQQVTQQMRLDDSDGGLRNALAAIIKNKWTLPQAEKKLRRYLKKHSNNAIATYNLAVIVDAQGRHEDALPLYDEAMRIHTRDYYVPARAGCARRASAKKSVFGEPEPGAAVEQIPDDKPAQQAPPVGEAPPPA